MGVVGLENGARVLGMRRVIVIHGDAQNVSAIDWRSARPMALGLLKFGC